MRLYIFVYLLSLLLILLFACNKEYSSKGGKQATSDSTYAMGFCDGIHLDVPIPDTSYFIFDSSATLPSLVMLDMPAAGNQGGQGSCSAWAVVYAAGTYYEHFTANQPYSDTGNLSPKFIYNQIAKGNCTCTSILDNLYVMQAQGACSLRAMPYSDTECVWQPDTLQREKALPNKIKGWQKLNTRNLEMVKQAIAGQKPVIIAVVPDGNFTNLKPPYTWSSNDHTGKSAHAIVVVGYDDQKNAFRIMNSWGEGWGDKGFAWIDYDFFSVSVVGDTGYVII